MTRVLYAIGALVLVALAAREIKRNGAVELRAERAEQRADSLAVYALERDRALRDDSLRYATDRKRWADSTRVLLARADHAAAVRPGVVTRIIQVAGDSAAVVQAVTELESLHSIEVTSLRSALVAADSVIATQQQELADYSYVNAQLRKALDASRAEAQAWEASSRGGGLFGIRISPQIAFGGGVLATLGMMVVLR